MNVTIMGGGKVSYNLARTLMANGADIHIIERNRERCRRLADELDIVVIHGDGTKLSTLERCNMERCDVFIALTGSDEDNLVSCDIVKKKYNVPKTVARASNPKNISIMKEMGINITVSSSALIAKLIEQEVDDDAMKIITNLNKGEASISYYHVPVNWSKSGKRIMDLKLPETSVIVAITRGAELLIPRGNTKILGGDELIILINGNSHREIKKIFEMK